MESFSGKTAWITGASSGIGKALAQQLISEGAKVIISSHDPNGLEQIKNNLQSPENCFTVPFDLSNPEIVAQTADKVIAEHKKIDILINNGGISQRSYANETSVEIDRKIMEIDYFSYVILTKKVLPLMLQNGGGYIAATSSISGKFGFPLRSAYAAAKHAIQGFFETVRAEYSKQNVSVTIAYPGRVKTDISVHALEKDGKAHGKMDDGQVGGISAEECARQYIKAIKKRKAEKLIGGKELLMVHIKRFFPRIFFKIVTKIDPT